MSISVTADSATLVVTAFVQTVDGAGVYTVGTLIAEKPQWIVLQGEPGTATIPPFEFTWKDTVAAAGEPAAVRSQMIELGMDIPMLEIVEQRERCRVAACFAAVTEDVERHNLDVALVKLKDLAAELAASPAKDTPFVIRLQAQVDDMIESLKPIETSPAPHVGGLTRSPAAWLGFAPSAAPSVAPVVSRLASNTTVLVNQRGFMSSAGRGGAAHTAALPRNFAPALFSSPSQRSASNRLATAYSSQGAAGSGSGSDAVDDSPSEAVVPPNEPTVTETSETSEEDSS